MVGSWRNQALGRLKPGQMNQTEARYAQALELRRQAGDIEWFRFEGITFKLADDTRYTPDFAVMRDGGAMEMHEVKGHFTDDAKVKIRVAAAQFPFAFVLVREIPKKNGGGWNLEPI